MAQCPDNSDDSDETFYCPDTDKDPGESRFPDSLSENDEDDDFYERNYNRYGPVALGALGPRPSFQDPDSDQTFFQLAESALRPDGGPLPDLPDTEETFFSPAEYGNRDGNNRASQQVPPSRNPDSPDAPASAPQADGAQAQHAQHGQHGSQGMFTHDLQWGQACSQFVEGRGLDRDQGLDGVAPVSPYDLYVEMPDPVTQEMRVFRVPGLQADPDTLRFLTQDFHWPQTQVLPAEALNGNDLHDRGLLGQQEAAPDPWRTEPTGEAPAGTGHAGATPALDTTRLDSQDLDWSQTQAEGVAMDMMEAPKHSGNSMELGSSSQDGAVAVGRPGMPPALKHALQALQQVGSSGSSEGRPVPSVPSFDDDLALPPAPHS